MSGPYREAPEDVIVKIKLKWNEDLQQAILDFLKKKNYPNLPEKLQTIGIYNGEHHCEIYDSTSRKREWDSIQVTYIDKV